MGVIIHEFEVVPEVTPSTSNDWPQSSPPPAPPPSPEQVERIHVRHVERRRRLTAD